MNADFLILLAVCFNVRCTVFIDRNRQSFSLEDRKIGSPLKTAGETEVPLPSTSVAGSRSDYRRPVSADFLGAGRPVSNHGSRPVLAALA